MKSFVAISELYLSEVHDGGSEVVGPPVVALGAGVPRSPVPANIHRSRHSHMKRRK